MQKRGKHAEWLISFHQLRVCMVDDDGNRHQPTTTTMTTTTTTTTSPSPSNLNNNGTIRQVGGNNTAEWNGGKTPKVHWSSEVLIYNL
jgi:hypothetical protein